MTRKHLFESGNYWMGDPCYVVAEEDWDSLLKDTGFFGLSGHTTNEEVYDDGLFIYNSGQCFAHQTAHGDGVYYSTDGNMRLGVDAGLLGILPEDVINYESGCYASGALRRFYTPFYVWEENGTFHFDEYVVPTGDSVEEEENDFYDEQDAPDGGYWGEEE